MEIVTSERINKLIHCINEHKKKPGPLVPTLHDAQKIFGCVPIEVQKIIAKELDESIATINGVVTFYAQFTLEPNGENVVSICLGTACYVKGAQSIIDKYSQMLNIKVGETSKDQKFTLLATRCIGACGLAPVLTINEEIHGNLTVGQAQGILNKTIETEGK